MAPRTFPPPRNPFPLRGRPLWTSATYAWRYVTADLRSWPDFVILGAQRAGTTSLYEWLGAHPRVLSARKKELHFFDTHYYRGRRWYRSNFPVSTKGRVTGEASPYMLFHPLAPGRAAATLPVKTRFVVLLREPVERAISHYWHSRRVANWETETFERAIELEPYRLAAVRPRVERGERSFGFSAFSYVSRGEYAGQLRRWFKAVGRERVLVLESERLFADRRTQSEVLDWLGLEAHDQPFPTTNRFERRAAVSPELLAQLRDHYEAHNRELFELLGHKMWVD
jgi:Sulfotransferase domain